MQKQAAQVGATLSRRAHGGKGHAAQGQIQISGGGDDGGVVATQFQQRAAKAGGDARANLAPHAGRAGCRDQRHQWAVNQSLAQIAATDQNGGQTFGGMATRCVEFGYGAVQQGMGCLLYTSRCV